MKGRLKIFGFIWVCDRITWTGGGYKSYCLKGPHEDEVLGYDALKLSNTITVINF